MKTAAIFWFTGLSGSGKSTVAVGVKHMLEAQGYSVHLVDGDEIRKIHHGHLGFTPEDIKENNDLIARMCKENRGKYDVILVPIISPFKNSRQKARNLLGPNFFEIYFDASLSCVVERDVKGLYTKAKRKEIDNLIGFSPCGAVYEKPNNTDFIVHSEREPPNASIKALVDFIIATLSERNSCYE